MIPRDKGELIVLLRDCVSETFGESYSNTQELFNKFLIKRGFMKPIEDKEPTAFQWSDGLVSEYADFAITALYPKAHHLNLPAFKRMKSYETSSSTPAGKGTANDVSNEEKIDWEKVYKSMPKNTREKYYPDIPTLDRQYEEGVGDDDFLFWRKMQAMIDKAIDETIFRNSK